MAPKMPIELCLSVCVCVVKQVSYLTKSTNNHTHTHTNTLTHPHTYAENGLHGILRALKLEASHFGQLPAPSATLSRQCGQCSSSQLPLIFLTLWTGPSQPAPLPATASIWYGEPAVTPLFIRLFVHFVWTLGALLVGRTNSLLN